ncbi:hypothetical protein J437_LFUL014849 [Ladona fulva]|uniref:Reverse transcriptase n=1 Tax=Ladona fulva TaxID=123851 RepID=A0A8K0KFT4_LADFU|nr:hypothetical protein J437_LFUL014849 [Ladona fulva]
MVNKIKYLEVIISERFNFAEHVTYIINKAKKVLYSLHTIARKQWGFKNLKIIERVKPRRLKLTGGIMINEVTSEINNKKEAIRKIKEHCLNLWQDRWDNSKKGRWIYKIINRVKLRIKNYLDYYTCQVISGHGHFNSKLEQFGLNDSGLCDCGARDTVEHFLTECPLYYDLRIKHLDLTNWEMERQLGTDKYTGKL